MFSKSNLGIFPAQGLNLCPLCHLHWTWDFPGKSTGVGSNFLFQGIFPTQGLNLGLLHSL